MIENDKIVYAAAHARYGYLSDRAGFEDDYSLKALIQAEADKLLAALAQFRKDHA